MNPEDYFVQIKTGLVSKFRFPEDKPEENIDTTIKALWYLASGNPKSAQEVSSLPLPKLNKNQAQLLNQLIEKRLNNIPLAHITGRQNFMGIEMKVDERALIPRKETEILGQKALKLSNIISCKKDVVNIIDVCCGSGNLAIALAHYSPNSYVFASDLLDEAIELAKENISYLNLQDKIELKKGDLFAPFESDKFYKKMDLIVCNPPYISTSKAKILSKEVHHEAVEAFDGGMLGINIIQRLIREGHKFLVPSGWMLFEVGEGQGDFVIKLCKNANLYDRIEFLNNEYGQQRVICVRKK